MSNTKKKICFISPKAYNIFNNNVGGVFGGAEVDLYYLATELAKDPEYDISFIVADYGQDEVEVIENVRVIKSIDFKANHVKGFMQVWRAMKKADAQAYMIKTATLGTALAAAFCRMHKRTFLYRTAHSSHCDGSWMRKNRLKAPIFKWAINNARLIFAQNDSDKAALKKTFGLNAITAANGHRIKETADSARRDILWVGRSVGFKRPELFLELAKMMPCYKFKMICQRATGDSKYERITEAVTEISNLEFIDRVPFHDISRHFAGARLFVNTSTVEGFPNTFIQSCLTGTPIASLAVNPDGFLDKNQCGICVDEDMTKICELINKLDNSEYFCELSGNALNYARKKHDIAKVVELYKREFEKIL